jgi:hypothetical protein
MRKIWVASAAVTIGLVLGATVLRERIAWAAQVVDAIIIGPLDSNGNVRVHEQGVLSARPALNANSIQMSSYVAASAAENGFGFSFPAATRVAVSSLTFTNFTGSEARIELGAFQPEGQDCGIGPQQGSGRGVLVDVVVPEGETLHLPYPYPVLAPRLSGNGAWCLRARLLDPMPPGLGVVEIGAVGYLVF